MKNEDIKEKVEKMVELMENHGGGIIFMSKGAWDGLHALSHKTGVNRDHLFKEALSLYVTIYEKIKEGNSFCMIERESLDINIFDFDGFFQGEKNIH